MVTLRKLYEEYYSNLSSKSDAAFLQNAFFRRLIPAMGGPELKIGSKQRIPKDSIEKGLDFLSKLEANKLNGSLEVLTKFLTKEGISESQQTKLRKSIRLFLEWARAKNYVSHVTVIPKADFVLRDLSKFRLEPTTPLNIWLDYLQENDLDRIYRNTLQNALVRYFLPASGVCNSLLDNLNETRKKPLIQEEIHEAMGILESTPMEVFDKALEITDHAVKKLNLSQAQGVRTRNSIKKLLEWARSKNFLPPLLDKERNLSPWKSFVEQKVNLEYNPRKIFESYLEHLYEIDRVAAARKIKSIVIRWVIPALGGPVPTGKRANTEELEEGLRFLEKVIVGEIWNIYNQKYEIGKSRQELNTNRHAFREMVDWACVKGLIMAQERETEKTQEKIDFDFYKTVPTQMMVKKKRPEKFTLGKVSKDLNALCPTANVEYINSIFEGQIMNYKDWRLSKGVAPGGLRGEIENILQIAGWLYHHKNLPLDQIRLESFIHKYDLVFPVNQEIDIEEHSRKTKKALLIARQDADDNIRLISEYLNYRERSAGSILKYLTTYIAVAKYLYRNEIGTYDFIEKKSIPIILKMTQLYEDFQKKKVGAKPTYSYEEYSVPWKEAILLTEYRRLRANKSINYVKKERGKGYQINAREENAIANDLQRFLSLAFCTLIFASRSRTYYELEIGRTFLEGLFINRKFYSVSELRTNPLWDGTTKYYLLHNDGDSKISRHQPAYIRENGWWAEVEDFQFKDGSSLYTYIKRWLQWGRKVGGEPEHNLFFFKFHTKAPLDCSSWRNRIADMFEGQYGVRVPPKNLRKMQRTFLQENKASQAVIEGEACALEHSERISRTEYDMQTTIDKIKPFVEFNHSFVRKVLKATLSS
jgi:hypothetical protein